MRKIATLFFAASLVSSSAFAQVTSIATNNPAPKSVQGDPNKIICEVERETGTRLGAVKICRTALEWQEMRQAHRRDLEMVQRMATSTGCPEGAGGTAC
ncbi:MAG TPA: hypothetical protein VJM15_02600 [Sphingomicrobium sp.]|nr:hypothetical protein [Sphingomicrobium sp.]